MLLCTIPSNNVIHFLINVEYFSENTDKIIILKRISGQKVKKQSEKRQKLIFTWSKLLINSISKLLKKRKQKNRKLSLISNCFNSQLCQLCTFWISIYVVKFHACRVVNLRTGLYNNVMSILYNMLAISVLSS